MERKGRAVTLLPGFEVIEEPTDVGEEQIADLRLLMERGLDLGERVFQVPMLVGKGKRGADLLEARGVLPLAQEPIGFQGRRKRKTPRIETCRRRPGQKSGPGALIGRETVARKVPAPRGLEQVGRKPLNVTALGARLLYFPQARRHFTQLDLFCNNRSYCASCYQPKGGVGGRFCFAHPSG